MHTEIRFRQRGPPRSLPEAPQLLGRYIGPRAMAVTSVATWTINNAWLRSAKGSNANCWQMLLGLGIIATIERLSS